MSTSLSHSAVNGGDSNVIPLKPASVTGGRRRRTGKKSRGSRKHKRGGKTHKRHGRKHRK
jgi:hypothetical protein